MHRPSNTVSNSFYQKGVCLIAELRQYSATPSASNLWQAKSGCWNFNACSDGPLFRYNILDRLRRPPLWSTGFRLNLSIISFAKFSKLLPPCNWRVDSESKAYFRSLRFRECRAPRRDAFFAASKRWDLQMTIFGKYLKMRPFLFTLVSTTMFLLYIGQH